MVSDKFLKQLEQTIREQLAVGNSVEDVIRSIHYQHGVGIMWIWPIVMKVCDISKADAMKLVVQVTSKN